LPVTKLALAATITPRRVSLVIHPSDGASLLEESHLEFQRIELCGDLLQLIFQGVVFSEGELQFLIFQIKLLFQLTFNAFGQFDGLLTSSLCLLSTSLP